MPVHRYESTLPAPPEEVFRWHARPGAFRRLVPPWRDVRVLEREGGLDGGRLVLEVGAGPGRFRWTLRHTDYEEGRLFRDEQESGLLGRWVHTHRFLPADGGRCRMVDEVEWEAPTGRLASTLAEPVIRRELDRVFPFRHRRLASDLTRLRGTAPGSSGPGPSGGPESSGGGEAGAPGTPMTVAITGSSGLIGSSLASFLTAGGHRVLRLVRSEEEARSDPDAVFWSVDDGEIRSEALEGVDAVVHLAGEPIDSRWDEKTKRRIRESRVRGTDLLARALAGLRRKPRVLVSASGADYYGDRGDEIVTESTPPGGGFLAEVTREWEAATRPAEEEGIRVVHLRSAMVLSAAGGALGRMLTPFRLGVAGRIGSGRQYMSWIDLDDEVGLIHHAIRTPFLSGPLNGSAPNPVTNATFTDTMGRVLGRPTLIPLPKAAVRLVFGEMGETLLLRGSRVRPARAEEAGFVFHHPSLEDSLRHQLGRTEETRPRGLPAP